MADRWQQWATFGTFICRQMHRNWLSILINDVQKNGLLRSETYAGVFRSSNLLKGIQLGAIYI